MSYVEPGATSSSMSEYDFVVVKETCFCRNPSGASSIMLICKSNPLVRLTACER